MKRWWFILAGGLALTAASLPAADVGLIRIDGPIGPATASYVSRAIDVAGARHDACLVIQLDTPGGLLDSTKEIVQKFYASPVPTVVYVSPSGASAGSAGCFITLAADVAAMAPNTSIGAAHPVSMNPVSGGASQPDEVMRQKLENYGASFIETIAEKRGRNVEWARAAVTQSAAITAEKALDTKVIDLIAPDVPDLLRQIDGREIGGHQLATAGATVVEIPMILREKIFQALWRPEVMFLLMLVAMYGLIGELSHPGAILPGVTGAIALILMLYMAAVLPVNLAGFALIGLAVLLFIIDIFAPTHGILTGGGIIAFFLGAIMLFDHAGPGFQLSLGYIIPGVLLTAAFFFFVVGAGLRAQMQRTTMGREAMPGKTARTITRVDAQAGRVWFEGEYWWAVSETPVEPDQLVEVLAVQGLTLTVKSKN